MIELLEINKNDVFIDLCSGTGSFPIESLKYNPKKIIACEYQKKLYDLLRLNSILRNDKINCINNDCFNENFEKCKKSAINPPYGKKNKNELEFILRQLEIIEENGLISAIILVIFMFCLYIIARILRERLDKLEFLEIFIKQNNIQEKAELNRHQ